MKDISEIVQVNPMPQLVTIRRIPMRYRRILPLPIMKQNQCIVVGAAQGILTVALTDRDNWAVIESLSRYTGRAIFPVLIEPQRMRLLLQRTERWEKCRRNIYSKGKQLQEFEYYPHTLHQSQTSSIVMLLSSQKVRDL